MKQFNKSIRIEISLDSIANRLLDMMKTENNPNAELVVETIIGSLQGDGQKMGMLYNSMVGWSNELAYQVGENVLVHRDHIREYRMHADCPYELPTTIEEIDIYRGEKNVKVNYQYLHEDNTWHNSSEWIAHTNIRARLAQDIAIDPAVVAVAH
jgi:hypothetical protein